MSVAEIELDEDALTEAHVAVEDVLIDFRDSRISNLSAGNGFVVKEKDGEPSPHIRLDTRTGLAIGIKAYLKAAEDRAAKAPNAPIKPRRVSVEVVISDPPEEGWCYGTMTTGRGDEVAVVMLDNGTTLRTFHTSRVRDV